MKLKRLAFLNYSSTDPTLLPKSSFFFFFFFLQLENRIEWCSDNVLDLNSGGPRYESRLGHLYPDGAFSWFDSFCLEKFRDIIWIKPRQLPYKCFPIHFWSYHPTLFTRSLDTDSGVCFAFCFLFEIKYFVMKIIAFFSLPFLFLATHVHIRSLTCCVRLGYRSTFTSIDISLF